MSDIAPEQHQHEQLRCLGTSLAPIAEGVIIVNAEGQVVFSNEAGKRLLRRAPGLGQPLAQPAVPAQQAVDEGLRYPDGRPLPPESTPLAKALAGEQVVNFLAILAGPLGKETYVLSSATAVKDHEGQVIGAYAICRDVSEHVRAKAERERLLAQVQRQAQGREEHLKRLDRLVQASERMLAQITVPGLLQSLLESARQLTGARLGISGYGYGNDVFRINASFGPDGLPLVPAGTELPMSRGGAFQDLFDRDAVCVRWSDAAMRRQPRGWGLPEGHRPLRGLLGARLSDAEQRVRGMVLLSDKAEGDFSGEDEALLCQLAALASLGLRHVEATREAERRAAELRAVLESIAEAVFVCDPQGRVTLANAAGLALLGKERLYDERTLFDYLQTLRQCSPDGQPLRREQLALARALGGEVVAGAQRMAIHPVNGRRLDLLFSAAPLRNISGQVVGAVAVARDISELTELDRLKDQFIAVAAHELRTPVTVMKGYAQVLPRTLPEVNPVTKKMLAAIEHGADRIAQIVGDLLDISRLQTGKLELSLERVDLADLVEEVVDRQSIGLSRHQLKVTRLDRVVVQADRNRLEQVLFNLIDNALRYSPAGGPVEVQVRADDEAVVVSVRDEGVGIPRGKQSRMFERFYRAHTDTPHDYGGMGVGLFISQEIVSRHGGKMWFASEEGQGSEFSFALPLCGEQASD